MYDTHSHNILAATELQHGHNDDGLGDSGSQGHYAPPHLAGDPANWKACDGKVLAANNGTMLIKGKITEQYQGLDEIEVKVLDGGLQQKIISIPRLADDGKVSVFDRKTWKVYDENTFQVNNKAKVIAEGYRESGEAGLYRMPKSPRLLKIVNNPYPIEQSDLDIIDHHEWYPEEEPYIVGDGKCIIPSYQYNLQPEKLNYMPSMSTYYQGMSFRNVAERVAFQHATYGHPAISTFHKAVKDHLRLPGITAKDIIDNAPKTTSTARGHLNNMPSGVNSTNPSKRKKTTVPTEAQQVEKLSKADDSRIGTPGYISEPYDNAQIYSTDYYLKNVGRLSADSTGNFPMKSYRGYEAVTVGYHHKTNYIRFLGFKSKTQISPILCGLYAENIALGHPFDRLRIDNEISNVARAWLVGHDCKVENVAQYNHQANPAERHIQTGKDHIIAILAAAHPNCPKELWCEVLAHAEATLNSMRPGPNGMSAYKAYWGVEYDLNAHPLAPWGSKCEAYVPRELRKTWGYRSQEAFYMGAEVRNYRGHRLANISADRKASICVRQQVVFFPHNYVMPKFTKQTELIVKITDLANLLKGQDHPMLINASETLAAYADSMSDIADDSEKEKMAKYEAGNGILRWIGNQQINNSTNDITATVEDKRTDAEKAETEGPINISPEQQAHPYITDRNSDNAVIDRIEVDDNNDANPIDYHSTHMPITTTQSQVSEGGDNIEHHEIEISEGDKNIPQPKTANKQYQLPEEQELPPAHIPTGNYTTRAQAREEYRQQTLDKLAEQNDVPERLNCMRICVLTENDHKTMTMKKAMLSANWKEWQKADGEELQRFESMPGVKLVLPNARPYGSFARNVIKVPEHKEGKERRIRAAYDGRPINGVERIEQYNQFSSDIDSKKIFYNALATNGRDHGVRHCTMDIGSFYLHHENKLPRMEYMYYPTANLSPKLKARYAAFIEQDRILLECGQAIYGMYDAGAIAGTVLSAHLIRANYYEIGNTCMWRSKKPGEELVMFNINVDDFDFQAIPGKGHKERLLRVLENVGYKVTHTEFGEPTQHFCGLQIYHDFKNHIVYVSMPGYVKAMLKKFGMENCKILDHPYKYHTPVWSKKQGPVPEDLSPMLNAKEVTELQQKIGSMQWYTIIAYEIVTALSKVAGKQAKPTRKLMEEANHILGYLAGRQNTALKFCASDMQLRTESDASFASEYDSKTRIGGIFLIGEYGSNGTPVSSPLAVISKIADCHPDSAAEGEYVAVHDIVKKGVHLRTLLIDCGFPQKGPTENRSDNKCAVNMTNNLVMDRKTKHIDRRFHWTRFEIQKGTFKVCWYKGTSNLADFFTKYLDKETHQRFTDMFTTQFTTEEGVLDHRPKKTSRD